MNQPSQPAATTEFSEYADLAVENPALASLGDGRVVEIDAQRGRAILEFTAKPEHCHGGRIVQGGFITGWVDSAMAHAAGARSKPGTLIATLELKISFLLPVRPHQQVRAEGWITRQGKSVAFLEGRLRDAEGELLATGSSTARLVRPKS